jgi:hypothetical protein
MRDSDGAQVWAFGFIYFAAFMMIMTGTFQALQGLAAIFEDSFFVVAPNYLYEIDVTAWGWVHLIWGIVVAVAGGYLFTGKLWARIIAIVVAGLSAIVNFTYIPYYPVWSLLIIALNVIVIWAVATRGGQPAD